MSDDPNKNLSDAEANALRAMAGECEPSPELEGRVVAGDPGVLHHEFAPVRAADADPLRGEGLLADDPAGEVDEEEGQGPPLRRVPRLVDLPRDDRPALPAVVILGLEGTGAAVAAAADDHGDARIPRRPERNSVSRGRPVADPPRTTQA